MSDLSNESGVVACWISPAEGQRELTSMRAPAFIDGALRFSGLPGGFTWTGLGECRVTHLAVARELHGLPIFVPVPVTADHVHEGDAYTVTTRPARDADDDPYSVDPADMTMLERMRWVVGLGSLPPVGRSSRAGETDA